MNDDEIRNLFQEMREEAVPADSLARVRMAVAARTQESRAWGWWAALVLAACCGIALLLWPSKPIPLPIPSAPIVAHRTVPVELPKTETRRVVHRVRRAPVRQPSPGTVVRIETNDPDVVILLVGD